MAKEKAGGLLCFLLALIVVLIVVIGGGVYYFLVADNGEKIAANKTKNNSAIDNSEYIFLYNGYEIKKEPGIQELDYMKLTEKNKKKYNIEYYNYNGEYTGKTLGNLIGEVLGENSYVENVEKIATSKKYNIMPRECENLIEIPNKLDEEIAEEFAFSWVKKVDLEGDGLEEYIALNNIGCSDHNQTTGKYEMISKVILYDNKLNKIADLVTLTDDYIDGYIVEIDLEKVNCLDIDNDGMMEILIEIPQWEWRNLSILKYNRGIIEGTINYKANIAP